MSKQPTDIREARAQMEAAKSQSEMQSSQNVLPRRFKLYDRIKDHVSLRTIDIVIAVTSLLIIAALVYGILTATPPS